MRRRLVAARNGVGMCRNEKTALGHAQKRTQLIGTGAAVGFVPEQSPLWIQTKHPGIRISVVQTRQITVNAHGHAAGQKTSIGQHDHSFQVIRSTAAK